MSTILKALKKAEQDCPDQDFKKIAALKFNVRTTLNSRMQRQRGGFPVNSKYLLFVLGFAIVAMAAAYLIVFGNKKAFQSEDPFRKMVPQLSVVAPAELNDSKPPVKRAMTKSLVLPTAGLENDTTPESEKMPPSQIIEKKTLATVSQPHTNPDINPDTKKKGRDAIPVITAIKEILPLEQGILKIQAIAWAQDPTERIAVINNEILGEKEFVQGYRLLHIKKDEVILQYEGREYKLVFKIR
ncbi:general secretion pathway protein GspB [Desulfobacula phenolica]|uniref:Type II secretion system protein B n=1 Tax=Desulfobacula phenolica TaxID=90732 RepID=A0A1H2EKH3_9BACT|nr:general secretion pathway protein GspB [Desulfobacula phenolica]SDT95463.1 Type II secretion system protein B [Desulfobacula phenolica]